MDIRKKISFILSIVMLAMTILPVATVVAATSATVTLTLDGKSIAANGIYELKEGSEVVVTGTPADQISGIVCQWGNNDPLPASKTSQVTIPFNNIQEDTKYVLKVYANCKDGSKTATKTFTFLTPVKESKLTVTLNDKTIQNGGRYEVKNGDRFDLYSYPTSRTESFTVGFVGGQEKTKMVKHYSGEFTACEPGQVYIMNATVNYIDGTKVGPQQFTFYVPEEEYTGSVTSKLNNSKMTSGKTYTAEPGATIDISAAPSDKVSKLELNWNGENPTSTTSSSFKQFTLDNPGEYKLNVKATFKNNTTKSESYTIKIEENYTGALTAKLNGTAMTSGKSYEATPGAKIVLTATPNNKVTAIEVDWNGANKSTTQGKEKPYTASTTLTETGKYIMNVTAKFANGTTKSGTYTITIKQEPVNGAFEAKLDGNPMTSGNTYEANVGAKIDITGTPSDKVTAIEIDWNGANKSTTAGTDHLASASTTLTEPGKYIMNVKVIYTDGSTKTGTYTINVKVPAVDGKLTAKLDSTTMKSGNTYDAKVGAKIVLTATPNDKVTAIEVDWNGLNKSSTATTAKPYTASTTLEQPGKYIMNVKAIFTDGSSKSGTYTINITKDAEPVNGKVEVTLNGNKINDGSEHDVLPGAPVAIFTTPADQIDWVYIHWKDGETTKHKDEKINFIIPKDAKNGDKYVMEVHASFKDGSETKVQTYTFNVKVPSSYDKDVTASIDGRVCTPGSVTMVTPGTIILVAGSPLDKTTSLDLRWAEDTQHFAKSSQKLKIADDAKAGSLYVLTAIANFEDGTSTPVKTYKFKIADEVVPPKGDLDIEPWMEENDDIDDIALDQLAISLRNDSEETEKANKNIYELEETVTYYIDYKNGGKDIDTECYIKLELPLEFKVVDADGGKVEKDTIVWTFPNGIEEGEKGTLIVKVKYTSLSKSKYDAETIYPSASILKGKKVMDVSTVINYIITDYDVEIDVDHYPYMFGDANADTFRPDHFISRAEGALVLARIFDLDYNSLSESEITTKYTDINQTYLEARKAITVATAAGLVNGYKENDGTYTFRPNGKMTKAEFIKILACMIQERANDEGIEGLEIRELTELIKKYDDTKKYYMVDGKKVFTHWAIEEVTLLARLNMLPFLTEDDPSFTLDEKITRAEVAQLVNAYLLRAPAYVNSKTKIGFSDVSRKHELIGDIIEATRAAHTFSITSDEVLEVEE